MYLCWVFSNSKGIPVLQSINQKIFCVSCIFLISSLLFSIKSSNCIRVYFTFTICFFACTYCCLWCLFASVIKRYCSTTCTKASSEKTFRHVLHLSVKSFDLWADSGRLLSNGRSHLLRHLHFPLILMLLLPSAKVSGLILIILSLILFHMIILLSLFASLHCLCPLYLYPDHMRRLYWYLPGSRLWIRRYMLLFLVKLGSCSLHPKILWVVDGSIPWNIALMVQWTGIRLGLLPKDILRPMAWTTLRLFYQLLN